MEGIEAGIHFQGLVHFSVSGNALHEVETSEPNGTILKELGSDHLLVFGKVLCAFGIVLVGRTNLERAVGHFCGLLLCLFDIDSIRIPSGQGAFPHACQVGFRHVTGHELFGGKTGSVFPFWNISGIWGNSFWGFHRAAEGRRGCLCGNRRESKGGRSRCRQGDCCERKLHFVYIVAWWTNRITVPLPNVAILILHFLYQLPVLVAKGSNIR
mmetsp:Transcript_14356/g.36068  ORF Transcript_14356/g.36068 Transcript_14356/m.36068 type:complete len:212 (-) Transcript_14356:67-702(-)